jgi:hypothetical protein
MKRLMMYSQDSMGLGHLRRSSNIAQEVLSKNPGCDVLIVADSPATSLFSMPEGALGELKPMLDRARHRRPPPRLFLGLNLMLRRRPRRHAVVPSFPRGG